jgi:hypothetical protein
MLYVSFFPIVLPDEQIPFPGSKPPPECVDLASFISLRSILVVLPTSTSLRVLIEMLETIPPSRNFELIRVVYRHKNWLDADWDVADELLSHPGLFLKIKVEFSINRQVAKSVRENWESFIVEKLPLSQQLGILSTNVICGSKINLNCTS